MPARFPRRSSDGSFSVDAAYSLAPDHRLDESTVQEWLESWAVERGHWPDHYSGEGVQALNFTECFLRSPQVVGLTPDRLVVRLRGRPNYPGDPRTWRDWYVRLSGDLVASHPEVLKAAETVDSPSE